MKLSEFVKMRREERGWTQKELAKYLGISVPVVIYLEQGRSVGLSTKKKVAKLFNADIGYIVGMSREDN